MTPPSTVLVVSEDPVLIHRASETLGPSGVRVTGCLGPAHSRCKLEDRSSCPLAEHAEVALVDSPSSGVFTCHWKVIQAGDYAERLQRAHPDCTVVLCGAPEGSTGPTGEVLTASGVGSVLTLLQMVFGSDKPASTASVV